MQLRKTDIMGRGGFGIVHRVIDIDTQSVYALKEVCAATHVNFWLTKETKDFPSANHPIDLMKREVYTLQNLNHKNVVKYFKSWFEGANSEQELRKLTTGELEQIFSTSGPERTDHVLNILMEFCPSNLRNWLNSHPNQNDRHPEEVNKKIHTDFHWIELHSFE